MGDRELIEQLDIISQDFQQKIPDITIDNSVVGVRTFMSNYNNCELFRLELSHRWRGDFDGKFVLHMGKRTPKWLLGYNEENAKIFVTRCVKYLKKQPLVSMHLAAYEMKQKFDVPMQVIAKRRGLEVASDVMVFMLVDELE